MMRNNSSLIILTLLIVLSGKLGVCRQDEMITMKVDDDTKGSQNSHEIESLGRFAVQEHNNKENGVLEFVKVLKAKEQVVAGKVYHLIVEAIDAGTNKIYEAKVWVKPWINFKQLQEFKHDPSFTHFHANRGR